MAITAKRPANFPAAPSTDGVSRQDEQSIPVEGRQGDRSEYGNREKKIADLPKFVKGNEKASARALDANGRANKGLWTDPDPDLADNRAKQQVYGSGEDVNQGQGQRANEDWHDDGPGFRHFALEADEISDQQSKIIDKHAPVADIFAHKSRSKEAYALSERAKSTRGKKN